MRQASFLVHGDNGAVADISFVVLGPAAGNVLDNVNRWLGQLAQPPVTEEKLKSMIKIGSALAGFKEKDFPDDTEHVHPTFARRNEFFHILGEQD